MKHMSRPGTEWDALEESQTGAEVEAKSVLFCLFISLRGEKRRKKLAGKEGRGAEPVAL